MSGDDPLRVIDRFDAAWNDHDAEGVLDLFIEDAVVRLVPAPPGEPEAYEGKVQVRDFVWRHTPGIHVESRDHQVAGHQEGVGDRVIWESTVSSERFRDLGVDEVEGAAEAIVKGGKIELYTFSLSHETLRKIRAAGEPE